ncbi:GIP [Symbiodinium sp. CCMP2592]|nr:GIP [Symbiodinium sp. CCMP2592]
MTEIARSKDGVPIWNGEAGTFQEFEETALIWEQSIALNKRYLCGPKLLAELTGAAKRLVAGKRHDWVSHNGGVQDLMKHLRACLGKPMVSDLTEHLNRYFKSSRRRPNESMNDYITRKCEVYLRACQALQRVIPHHETTGPTSTTGTNRGLQSRRSSWDSAGVAPTEAAPEVQAAAPVSATGAADDDDEEHETSEQGPDAWSSYNWQWRGSQNWWCGSYGGYGNYQGSWANYGDRDAGWSPPDHWRPSREAPTTTMPELLPDFVQGWYLLQDSGLDQSERNVIMAALGGEFTLQRVAQELRTQWSGQEAARRREQGGRQSGFLGDAAADEPDQEASDLIAEEFDNELDEEGYAMVAEAEEDAQSAMAAMDQAKRTLRAARARQHNVRMSRQYYRASGKGFSGGGRGKGGTVPDDSKMTCMRCGKQGHRIANCPQPPPSAKVAEQVEATSSFICFNDVENEAAYVAGITTAEAVHQGKAVIDGGATRTLASISAMEAIMALNQSKHGHNGVAAVDLKERPVFGFGNGSENQCASTVQLKIAANSAPGVLKVHCLDHGSGPLLLSVDSLRKLGAIVDFAEDLVCFRSLDANQVIQVERSATGHQLLPMTDDLMKQAKATKLAIPSLREYLAEEG